MCSLKGPSVICPVAQNSILSSAAAVCAARLSVHPAITIGSNHRMASFPMLAAPDRSNNGVVSPLLCLAVKITTSMAGTSPDLALSNNSVHCRFEACLMLAMLDPVYGEKL